VIRVYTNVICFLLVGGVTKGVTDTVGNTTKGVTDTVGGATGGVGKTVNDTGTYSFTHVLQPCQ